MKVLFLIFFGLMIFSGCKKETPIRQEEVIDQQLQHEAQIKQDVDQKAVIPPDPVSGDEKEKGEPKL